MTFLQDNKIVIFGVIFSIWPNLEEETEVERGKGVGTSTQE